MARSKEIGRSSKSFATNWNKAASERGDGLGDAVPVEPGNYVMQLCRASIDDYDSGRKIMLKFVVLEPEESAGAICTFWEGVETDERLIWLQRLMIAIGIDLESVTIESEDDLLAAFQEMIKNGCACKVRVIEKDGYTNMRVLKAIESDELLDPDEAMNGASKNGAGKKAKPKAEEQEDESEDEPVAITKDDINVGDWIDCKIDGDVAQAEITSKPPKGTRVQIRVEGEESVKMIDVSDIVAISSADDKNASKAGSNDDETADDDGAEELKIEVGDIVTCQLGKKKIEVEVIKINGDEVKVKTEEGKIMVRQLEELELVLEE